MSNPRQRYKTSIDFSKIYPISDIETLYLVMEKINGFVIQGNGRNTSLLGQNVGRDVNGSKKKPGRHRASYEFPNYEIAFDHTYFFRENNTLKTISSMLEIEGPSKKSVEILAEHISSSVQEFPRVTL